MLRSSSRRRRRCFRETLRYTSLSEKECSTKRERESVLINLANPIFHKQNLRPSRRWETSYSVDFAGNLDSDSVLDEYISSPAGFLLAMPTVSCAPLLCDSSPGYAHRPLIILPGYLARSLCYFISILLD